MSKNDAQELIKKYLDGTCTEKKRTLLERYYQEQSATRKLDGEIDFDKIRSKFWEETCHSISKSKRKSSFQNWALAASVVFILGASFWFFTMPEKSESSEIKLVETVQGPAKQTALLTLADGSVINLDDAQQGVLSHQGGRKVVKLNDGRIVYSDIEEEPHLDKIAYNTVATPMGSYYHLTLSDGSEVWLNAGSSITYPVSFYGAERTVSITGEVYFEVAQNKKRPFKVKVNSMEVEVLGTHFNIMSYEDEDFIKTTLLEGSVKVKSGTHNSLLKPGQQASVNDSEIQIYNADLEEAVSWKNGYFMFNNEDITGVMRKISRWYDVDVEYGGAHTNKKLTGSISRSENITEVLKMLELTGLVHFKIEGRRVIVMR